MIWNSGKKLKNGRYTIVEVLAERAFSITYLAQSVTGDQVVIKTPNDDAIPRADFDKLQERFVDEAVKLTKCQKSRHIVQVEDPFQEDGFWCIPMEYVAGMTLDKRNPLKRSETEAIRYIRQVGEALSVIHALNLIHRDVTPENIILRSHDGVNEAVLIDFGLVRDFQLSRSVTSTQKITSFTARELCLSQQERGSFTDLYSLGAVLYALVTGDNPPMAVDRVPGEKLKFSIGISEAVAVAIEKAMALKGIDRPSSVAEWLMMLPVEQLTPPPEPPEPPSQPEAPDDRRKKQMEIVTLILTALGVLFGAFQGIPAFLGYFFPKDPPPVTAPSNTPIAPSASISPTVSPSASPKPK
jgi:eukaryotic-like serine/threonine-protein kinase